MTKVKELSKQEALEIGRDHQLAEYADEKQFNTWVRLMENVQSGRDLLKTQESCERGKIAQSFVKERSKTFTEQMLKRAHRGESSFKVFSK